MLPDLVRTIHFIADSVGARLIEARKQAGLDLDQLAASVSMVLGRDVRGHTTRWTVPWSSQKAVAALYTWEVGLDFPDFATIEAIAKVYEVTVVELLSGSNS